MEKQTMSFIKFLGILAKYKKSLFINLFLVAIISVIASLYMPKWYKATAVVVPPPQENAGGGFSSLLNSLPLSSFGISAGGGNELTYMAILKSRTLAMDVINKFKLKDFYEKKTYEETLLSYYSDFDAMITEENLISISFEYTDSVKVAEIVNYIVKRLDEMSNKLVLERARKNYEIAEKRYFQNIHDIDSLSLLLEQFQKKYGVIEFYEQTKSIISAITDLEAKTLIKKAELEAIEENFGKDSPQYKAAKIQLDTFNKQVNELKSSHQEDMENPFASLFIPLDKIPTLGKEYTEIYTNLLLQQKLKEFLVPQYEQAKMQLLKKEPTLQILDVATPPDYKSKPKRAFIVIGALFVAFLLHFSILLIVERLSWLKLYEPEKFAEINDVWKNFSSLRNK